MSFYFCVHQHACEKRENLHHMKISCYTVLGSRELINYDNGVLWVCMLPTGQQYNGSYSILRLLLEYWSGLYATSACMSPVIHFNAC